MPARRVALSRCTWPLYGADGGTWETQTSARGEIWWQGRDSNPRHKAYEASALPLSYPAAKSSVSTPFPGGQRTQISLARRADVALGPSRASLN